MSADRFSHDNAGSLIVAGESIESLGAPGRVWLMKTDASGQLAGDCSLALSHTFSLTAVGPSLLPITMLPVMPTLIAATPATNVITISAAQATIKTSACVVTGTAGVSVNLPLVSR